MLLSPLEPQYCVEQAMNAILVDQPLVCIPRLTYLPVISRAYVGGKKTHLCHLGRQRHGGVTEFHLHSFSSAFSFRLLPWEANVVTYRFMGSDKCMYPFIDAMSSQASSQRPVQVA